MIAQPILRWLYGEQFLMAGVTIAVILQAAAVLAILLPAWGAWRTVAVGSVVALLAWSVEFVGSTTGFPFGHYDYTSRLQPQLGGVPLLIPLAWLMMLPPAWAVAGSITARWSAMLGRVGFVIVAALAFTAWDLFLDPQMVRWGFWVWQQPGEYFGIPLVNYAGWLLSSALITGVVYWLIRPPSLLKAVTFRPLLLVYAITWALESVGLSVFWGMPGPALFGFVAMGAMLLAAWSAKSE
jgi:putative membrane protein